MTSIYKVKWADLKIGDEVHIYGTHLGEPHAYGPHYVVNTKTRSLKNSKGRQFRHVPDDLVQLTRHPA